MLQGLQSLREAVADGVNDLRQQAAAEAADAKQAVRWRDLPDFACVTACRGLRGMAVGSDTASRRHLFSARHRRASSSPRGQAPGDGARTTARKRFAGSDQLSWECMPRLSLCVPGRDGEGGVKRPPALPSLPRSRCRPLPPGTWAGLMSSRLPTPMMPQGVHVCSCCPGTAELSGAVPASVLVAWHSRHGGCRAAPESESLCAG